MNPVKFLLPLLLGCATGESHRPDPELRDLPAGVQALSLSGTALRSPELPAETQSQRRQQLDEARARYAENPDDADALIWFGRRMAYLGLYREAIGVFTEGIHKHPYDARMYRHRGHRWITLRRFQAAVDDLAYAARLIEGQPDPIEPDGLPNAQNIPTSTLASNIFYHLGLAHYLKREFPEAERAYRRCLPFSNHPDLRVATIYWLVLCRRRLGQHEAAEALLAEINADLELIENHDYLRLLLLFKGELLASEFDSEAGTVSGATLEYGLGCHALLRGDLEAARARFQQLVEAPGANWAAFGYIAAESELMP